jgi:hypothetical protein
MSVTAIAPPLDEHATEVLRRAGNPFRNYFARNPDDEVCAKYHVPDLFARERNQLLGVVDLYRYDNATPAEVVPVLGNKGAGKTHLLHSIKHGTASGWQLLVTPGTYQKDSDFLEYLLFQVIDTLLGGGTQHGVRPLQFVSDDLTRRQLALALTALPAERQTELFPAVGLAKWARKFGLGTGQAQERTQWLVENLGRPMTSGAGATLQRICDECHLEPQKACDLVCDFIQGHQTHGTAGLMRRHIYQGFARAALLGDESDLASFLTFGFAEVEFNVRPSRQELVLSLFKVLMEVFLGLKMPVVVAFDQLEDLLLARRTDDGRRVAEAFFAGIVQVMHQVSGICFLVFAERGLWNRFVPSLDGYIQDRLNNPVHIPNHGTIKALRLEAPPPDLVRRVVEARLRPALQELGEWSELPTIYPFTPDQILRVARTEPTLRDMLQQFRHLYDHIVYGEATGPAYEQVDPSSGGSDTREVPPATPNTATLAVGPLDELPIPVKSVVVVQSSSPQTAATQLNLREMWDQELRSARRQLEPEGALTGATRELQAGLGAFIQCCHEHGVKVGPWRLQHAVAELAFGEHPTYGVMTIAHWACKGGQPWKVGVGLFLGRGPGKPKDLEIKLGALDVTPPIIDHLILLRPEDDLGLTGKSKTLWQTAEKQGRHARLEAVSLDGFSVLYAFPRFLSAIGEALPAGQPLPNLADSLQEWCEKLLEQLCMPVRGG